MEEERATAANRSCSCSAAVYYDELRFLSVWRLLEHRDALGTAVVVAVASVVVGRWRNADGEGGDLRG